MADATRKIDRALKIALVLVGSATALVFSASAASSQARDTTSALVHGRRSIAFAIPESAGGTLEIWRMRSETLNRGLIVRFRADAAGQDSDGLESSSRSVMLLAGPAFRRYIVPERPVAPFLQTTILAGGWYRWSDAELDGAESPPNPWEAMASVQFGLGAEWFPHRLVSINGHTGARLSASYAEVSRSDRWSVAASTFISSLALQIYF